MRNVEYNRLTLFEKGQHSSDIRSVYEDLLCKGGIIRVFQITLRSGGMENFAGVNFFIGWWKPGEE